VKLLDRYNEYYNDECAAAPWGSLTSMEHLQATTIRAVLYAFARKYDMTDKIYVEDLELLANQIEAQGNESNRRHETVMKASQGHTRTDLDALQYTHTHRTLMSNFYTLLPGTDVLRSKIDVLTWTNPENENETERVELTVDNAGIFVTSCSGGAREDMSIAQKDLAIGLARAILEAYGVG